MSNLSHLFYITNARVIPPPDGMGRVHRLSDVSPKSDPVMTRADFIDTALVVSEDKIERVLAVLSKNPLPTAMIVSRAKINRTTARDALNVLVGRGRVKMTHLRSTTGHYWSLTEDE